MKNILDSFFFGMPAVLIPSPSLANFEDVSKI